MLLALFVVALFGAALAAQAGAKPKHSCFALISEAKHGLSFTTLQSGHEGLASAATHRASQTRYVGQSTACAESVTATRLYRARLRYSATAPVGLEVLKHSRHGWSLWYRVRTLGRAKHTTGVAATLAAVPAGVDKVAFELALKGSVSVHVGGFSIEYLPPHSTPPVTKSAGTPASPVATTPSGGGEAQFPIGPGSWSVMTPPKLNGEEVHAVHAVLLQNGKVLIMAGSGNVRSEFEGGRFSSWIYDPVANTWKYIPTPKDVFCSGHVQLANGNVLIIGGTKAYPPETKPGELPSTKYEGENASWIFNIRTEQYENVKYKENHQPAEPGPLLNGAWYASATELGNGDVISFGGLKENGQGATATDYFTGPGNEGTEGDATEEWVGFGSHKLQQTYDWFWGLYPTMILTADGRLFYTGSHVFGQGLDNVPREGGGSSPEPNAPEGSSIYDFYCTPGKSQKEEEEESGLKAPGVMTNRNAIVKGPNGEFKRVTDTPGLRDPDNRDQSTSLLLPPAQSQKVMIMGGGETYSSETDAIDLTDEINLKEPSPHWTPGPNLPQGELESGGMEPMGAGKMYVSAVALPDGNVLETGGSLLPRRDNVREASVFDPQTNTFTPVAADPVGRNYHSEALLLPDGRVLTLGSNPANKETGEESWETRISIYTPSYLQEGTRPSVSAVDGQANVLEGSVMKTTQWEYGTEHQLSYSSPSAIKSAVLIRPAAVTHSSDPNQREVALELTGGGSGSMNVRLPSNPNITPPGYYMLFLVDSQGVPSVAQWVHVGSQGAP